jgi:hypothetical protein
VVTINFDEPSEGRIASDRNALAVTNTGAGVSLWAHTEGGGAVHGETRSDRWPAVAGVQLNDTTNNNVPGIWGSAVRGEAVHGETRSDRWAAVAGIQLNDTTNNNVPGIWG